MISFLFSFWKTAVVTTEDNFHRLTKHIHQPLYPLFPHTLPWTWKSISWEEFNTNLIKALFIASSFSILFKAFLFIFLLFFKADFVQFNAQSRHNCVFHLQGCYNSSTAQKWEKLLCLERGRERGRLKIISVFGKTLL